MKATMRESRRARERLVRRYWEKECRGGRGGEPKPPTERDQYLTAAMAMAMVAMLIVVLAAFVANLADQDPGGSRWPRGRQIILPVPPGHYP